MTRKAIARWTMAMVGLLALVAGSAFAAGSTPVGLVVPARYSMVEMAFDLMHVRSMPVISYEVGKDPAAPRLFVWNAASRQWTPTDLAAYRAGTAFGSAPDRVVIVGATPAAVDMLAEASGWCRDVKKIPALDRKEIVNALNEKLAYTPSEWNWLSQRTGVQYRDENAELRAKRTRYGMRQPEGGAGSNPLVHWLKEKPVEPEPKVRQAQPPAGQPAAPALTEPTPPPASALESAPMAPPETPAAPATETETKPEAAPEKAPAAPDQPAAVKAPATEPAPQDK